MASSSDEALDESIPEMVYQCISLLDEDNSKRDITFIKCNLCNQFGKKFHCIDCVRSGNFTHSKKKCLERFADKKPKKYKLDEEKVNILQKYAEVLSQRKQKENLKFGILRCKEKIALLERNINLHKENISKDKKFIEDVKKKKIESVDGARKLADKCSKLHNCIKKNSAGVEEEKVKLQDVKSSVSVAAKQKIKELETHIFPVTVIQPPLGTFAALKEAMKDTNNISDCDVQYTIVQSLIPGNGDYSSYLRWCTSNKQESIRNNLEPPIMTEFDVAYGISSALGFTAQFVNVIAKYLDVHVPRRCTFNDFCVYESEEKFYHSVAKLNANIIDLCLSQGVDITKLSTQKTIANLLLLLSHKTDKTDEEDIDKKVEDVQNIEEDKAGRASILKENEECLNSLERSLAKDLQLSAESEDGDEDSDDLEAGFVHLSEDEDLAFEVPDNVPPSVPPPNIQPSSLISSVASLWRAATGLK